MLAMKNTENENKTKGLFKLSVFIVTGVFVVAVVGVVVCSSMYAWVSACVCVL